MTFFLCLPLRAEETGAETPENPKLLPSEERERREQPQKVPAKTDPGSFSPMGGMGGGNGPLSLTGSWLPRQSITSQPYSLGSSSAAIRGGVPLWMPGGPIFTASVQQTWFDIRGGGPHTPLRLPRTGSVFPDSLTNVSFGLIFRKTYDNGWIGMLGLNAGSASDKPFHSIREVTGGMFGSLIVPRDRDAWIFSFFFSPTSQLWFPVPGVAYRWQPNEQWTVNLGLPFSVQYRPDEMWRFDLSYVPITNINARITAKIEDWGSVYLGYSVQNDSYFLADREVYRDRFVIVDQRVVTGINVPLVWKFTADLSTGYAFGRYFYEGQSSTGASSDRLYVGSGMFANMQVGLKF